MITEFNRDVPEKNLPDAYRKTSDSNNHKILAIEKYVTDELRTNAADITASLDIDQATGYTLELYGEMIGQVRGTATDEQYRAMLKGKIFRNVASSDYNSIIHAIASAFECEPTEITLYEDEAPCTVRIDGLPYEALNRNNIDLETAKHIIGKLIPAGVLLESLGFTGTFEFADTADEYDADAGFGNVAQTVGGYFGLLADSSGSELPV